MNVSLLTCLAMRNFLPISVGADRAGGGWLSSNVCDVGAVGDGGVSTVIDGELYIRLSYGK